MRTLEVEHRGDHRGADDGDEHGRHRAGEPRQDEQHRQDGQPDEERVVFTSSSPWKKARTSSTKPSASVEKPHNLGSWPTTIVTARPFM